MRKVAVNFFYQGIYQILLIILPIITVPIVSNALGPSGLGTYSYVNSVTMYFQLVAGLGLANYGAREVARNRDSRSDLSRTFWEIQKFNAVSAFAVLLTFLIITRFLRYSGLYLIQAIAILGTLLDISWFYSGIEDFKQITLANGVVKLLGFVLIVLLVNNSSDLVLYFVIQSSNVALSQLVLWFFLRDKVDYVHVSIKRAFVHFKPALSYFLGKAAISFYTTLNTTLLGIMTATTIVGYYTNSLQLSSIVIALIGSLDAVLLPKMSNLYRNGSMSEFTRVIEKTLQLEFYISIPAMFGICLISDKFVPWFFGSKFLFIENTVPLLAPLVVIIPLGVSINRQFLIPKGQVRDFNISVIGGAIVGVILNLILVPRFGIFGAIIATLAAQFIVTAYRIFKLYRDSLFRFDLELIAKITLSSTVMLFTVKQISRNMAPTASTTLLQVILGIVVYQVCLILFRTSYLEILKDLRKNKR